MHCSQATHLSFGSYATRFALPQQTHGGACFVQSCQQRVPFPSLLALPPGCGCTTTTLATMTPQTRAHLRRGVSSLAAAAPETPPDTPPESFPLLDLPAPALRLVLLSLWADAGDCAAFACCSTATAALCDDRHLWRALLARRYGPSVLPGLPLSPAQWRPQELEAWLFYQGVDGSQQGSSSSQTSDAPDKSLAQLAAESVSSGCEAFTTTGSLISCVEGRQQAWCRFSYKPSAGMYVRQQVVEYRELALPSGAGDRTAATPKGQQQQAEAAAEADAVSSWPPDMSGWTYYPCSVSPGYFEQEPPANLARYASLAALLAAAAANPTIAAVTPAGETKRRLRSPACWRTDPAFDVGLYVKESVVQQMGLPPPTPVPDYRALAAKLRRLRLTAGAMDACWLDDQHLELVAAHDSPLGPDEIVLLLRDVWWLDITGSIPGVPPGRYEIVWTKDCSRCSPQVLHGLAFNLSAAAAPISGAEQRDGAAAAPGSGSSVTLQLSGAQILQQMAAQRVSAASRWVEVSGGTLDVRAFSTVHLRFWSHEGWKHGLRWSHAELRPLATPGASDGSSRRSRQQQQQLSAVASLAAGCRVA